MKDGNGASAANEVTLCSKGGITYCVRKQPPSDGTRPRAPCKPRPKHIAKPKNLLGRGRSPQQEKAFYGGRHALEPDSTKLFRTTSKGLRGRSPSGGVFRLRHFVINTSRHFGSPDGESVITFAVGELHYRLSSIPYSLAAPHY